MNGKKILIIGGTGSLGHSLVDFYGKNNKIIVLSRDENKQWAMMLQYKEFDISFVLGDVRNSSSIKNVLSRHNPQIVIMAAALKHVDICENNIEECIDTNINGVKNLILAIQECSSVEKTLFISTDKSTSPVNVYGMCKAISERLISNASTYSNKVFLNVRYGNVISSRGSIVEKYHSIGKKDGGVFEVTNGDMTRFFMTLKDSVKLIDDCLNNGKSGETWIPQIKAFRIIDVARYFSKLYNKDIRFTSIRPGEKMHEVLVNLTEISRTRVEKVGDKNYYVISSLYEKEMSNIIEKKLEYEYSSRETYPIDCFISLLFE